MEERMSPITRMAALAIAASLAMAACEGDDEVLVTAVPDVAPSADASAVAGLSARVDELEAQLDEVEARLGDAAEAQPGDAEALGDLEAKLDDVEARLGDVDPVNLRSRLSELEQEVDLLSAAFEDFQAPTNLGGSSPDATE
jgi:DNA repair ATPase RecN